MSLGRTVRILEKFFVWLGMCQAGVFVLPLPPTHPDLLANKHASNDVIDTLTMKDFTLKS